MPNTETATRQDVIEYFNNCWAQTEVLFACLQGAQGRAAGHIAALCSRVQYMASQQRSVQQCTATAWQDSRAQGSGKVC
jgi:hypothetical protein